MQGHPFSEDSAFSFGLLKSVFSKLSNINFCACRAEDFAARGEEQILKSFYMDVSKNLVYIKEYTALMGKAEAWTLARTAINGARQERLLQEGEALAWAEWIDISDRYNQEPRPTELMRGYVDASQSRALRRGRSLKLLKAALIVVLLAAVAVSSTMAVIALQSRREAEKLAASEASANHNTLLALHDAEASRAEAILDSRTATAMTINAVTNRLPYTREWELQLMHEALAHLPVATANTTVNTTLLEAGTDLFQKPFLYHKQVRECGQLASCSNEGIGTRSSLHLHHNDNLPREGGTCTI